MSDVYEHFLMLHCLCIGRRMRDRTASAEVPSGTNPSKRSRDASRVRDLIVEVRDHLHALRAAQLITPREFEGVWRGFQRLTRSAWPLRR